MLEFTHPLMYGIYIILFVVCTILAYVFIAKDKMTLFYWLIAILYLLISWIFLDMTWQMSITALIVLTIALLITKSKNTYDVFKKYIIWSISFIVLNFIIKWFVLYFDIPIIEQIDSIGICCFDLLSICISCEAIYSSIRFSKNNEWEKNNILILDKLKEFSFYKNINSFYQLNYMITKNMRNSLSIPEINYYYEVLQKYITDNYDTLCQKTKEYVLDRIFDVYQTPIKLK